MRYAIIEEDLGFFLGSYQKYGIFAKTDVLGITKAYTFASKKEAEEYIDDYLGRDRGDWKVLSIKAKDKYTDVVDLIKEGYGKYTHTMIDSLPMESTAIH